MMVKNYLIKTFKNIFNERCNEKIKIIDETHLNDLIYYFKNDTSTKRFDDFETWIELLEKKN